MDQAMILRTIQEDNILPLTSICNVSCIFCSHKNNPTQLAVVKHPPRELEEVLTSLEFLDPKRKIVMGESATRISEGEPLSHPHFIHIIEQVRRRFPHTMVAITTNGNLLTQDKVKALAELQPLELTISLNSSDPQQRQMLMGTRGETGIMSLELLAQAHINFHGSVVAMPWLTGWEDLMATVKFLDIKGAETIRIFLPGYTKDSPVRLQYDQNQLQSQLVSWVADTAPKLQAVLLLEPPEINELHGELAGVLPHSPAAQGGLRAKDILLQVAGKPVHSRVAGFKMLEQAANPQVILRRQGELHTVTLTKPAKARSGVVVDYDVHLDQLKQVAKLLKGHKPARGAILTSQWGAPLVKMGLIHLGLADQLTAFPVPSVFFGGSIKAAGLLVVEDFSSFIQQHQQELNPYPLLILPEIAFDREGRDLTNRYYWELEEVAEDKKIVLG